MRGVYDKRTDEYAGVSTALILLAIFAFIMILGGLGLQNNIKDCQNHGGEWIAGRCHIQEVGQ